MPHTGTNENPTPDIALRGMELLDKIIEVIEEMPEHWGQGDWAVATDKESRPSVEQPFAELDEGKRYIDQLPESCGTAFCVAGWAAHLTGAKILWRPEWGWDSKTKQDYVAGASANACIPANEEHNETSIAEHARAVLELTYDESDALFSIGNSLPRIKTLRDRIERRKAEQAEQTEESV